LKMRDRAGAEALAAAVSDPTSATAGQFLTPTQFRARFSPSDADVASVTSWLVSTGLKVGTVSANHLSIEASGSAAQLSATFGVQLDRYKVAGALVRAPANEPSVPASLASLVDGIGGLTQTGAFMRSNTIRDDLPTGSKAVVGGAPSSTPSAAPSPGFRNAPPCSTSFGTLPTHLPAIGAGYGSPTWAPCGYTPTQLRSAYGTDAAVAHGVDGSGTTVAVVDAFAAPTIFADAKQYSQRHDPSHVLSRSQFSQVVPKAVFGASADDPCDPQGWYGEETLDVEAVHSMAPGATLVFEGGKSCNDDDLDVALLDVVDNARAQIVTNSYGDLGEVFIPRSELRQFDQISIQAAIQGIGLYFSSGDDGDESADPDYVDDAGNPGPVPTADFSASSPWVTAEGGTSLAVGANGRTLTEEGWATGLTTYDPVAKAWDTPGPGDFLYGAGGGPSRIYSEPWYQQGAVSNRTARALGGQPARVVPDVAMVGDPQTGMLVGQTQTFSTGVSYDEFRIGGTSLSSPLFAGMMALVDQLHGRPTGFANPTLYRASRSAYSDVSRGPRLAVARNNYVNGEDATDGLAPPSGRTIDAEVQTLRTNPGYDTITGLGTPNGLAFLAAISSRH
jgi:subtilase family serine protease